MTAIDLIALRCDYADDDGQCASSTLLRAPTRVAARQLAHRGGWRHRCAANSRHEFDLCPVHAHDVPGETFPNWRAHPLHEAIAERIPA